MYSTTVIKQYMPYISNENAADQMLLQQLQWCFT